MPESEQLIRWLCEASVGDQRTPARARVELPPEAALAMVWVDYARGPSTTVGEPDLVHYAPTHDRPVEQGKVFEAPFSELDGPNRLSHWTREDATAQSLTSRHSSKSKEGQTYAPSGSAGAVLLHINRDLTLNVEMAECEYNDDYQAGLVCGSGARWNVAGNACNGVHCNNKALDGNETSIDCGGDCGPICL